MRLHKWEVWHTYSTYCVEPILDLEPAAASLVRSGLAACAVQSDGLTHWMHDGRYVTGMSEVEPSDAGTKARLGLDCPEEVNPTGLALETWYQANYFRWSEMRVFGHSGALLPSRVQAMLGPCDLHRRDGDSIARCYAGIKLYAPGVLLLEFRVLSPQEEVSSDRFIDSYLRLHSEEFEEIFVPPSIVKLLGRAIALSDEPDVTVSRFHSSPELREFDAEVDELSETTKAGDFEYSLAPLVMPDDVPFRKTLPELAEMLFAATAVALARTSRKRWWSRTGDRTLHVPSFGLSWEGRTHTHLIDFHDQRRTAKGNITDHAHALGSIMIGVNCGPEDSPEELLPPSKRPSSDYSVHIRAGNTLWVWAQSGRELQAEWKDPNQGEFVYEHQATVQLAEYGYTLHRRLLAETSAMASPDRLLNARRALVDLRLTMRETGTYGEVRELLDTYWKSMRVPELQADIEAGLRIEQAKAQLGERRAVERVGRAITAAVAVLAAPTLAREFVTPLWVFLKLPAPNSQAAFQLIAIATSVCVVITVVVGVPRVAQGWLRWRRRAAT